MTHKQSGFTLVELAIVLAIIGMVMGGSMMMMKPYVESARINATREKLNNISDALALFAQTYNRLPCPANPNNPLTGGAEPFGSPLSSGIDGSNFVDTDCGTSTLPGNYIGIVPFRALGLTQDNVRDGYGNLITYSVSAVLAEPVSTSTRNVQQICRTPVWTDGTTAYNARKARFCCPYFRNANADIQVLDGLASANQVFIPADPHDNGAGYSSVTTPAANPPTDRGNRLIAFALVSHGKNGDRAYIGNSGNRNPVTANAGAQESENSDDDLVFVDRPISMTTTAATVTNYFDDLIAWRTNDQLMSAFGNNSCGRP